MESDTGLYQEDTLGFWANLRAIELPEIPIETETVRNKQRVKKSHYIRTVPLEWANCAAQLPACAVKVGWFVWYYFGLRPGEWVVFSPQKAARHGLNKSQVYRGLRYLKEAGLIDLEQQGKQSPKVKPVWEGI